MSPVRVNRKEILENLNLRIIYINMNIVQYTKICIPNDFTITFKRVHIYHIYIYIYIYFFLTYLYTLKFTSAFFTTKCFMHGCRFDVSCDHHIRAAVTAQNKMLHSRAIGIIINTSFLVGNWT